MDLDILCENLELQDLVKIIQESQNLDTGCNQRVDSFHKKCFNEILHGDKKLFVPQCPDSLNYFVITVLAHKPNLIDEESRNLISNYYERNNIKVGGLMSLDYLILLETKTKIPKIAWLKFETLATHLIKKQVYEPKSVANELLTIVKEEIPQEIRMNLGSVIESCVKFCREANKHCQEEEEEEKWCEIIDWMSWLFRSPY